MRVVSSHINVNSGAKIPMPLFQVLAEFFPHEKKDLTLPDKDPTLVEGDGA
jgi:hypothetical protein